MDVLRRKRPRISTTVRERSKKYYLWAAGIVYSLKTFLRDQKFKSRNGFFHVDYYEIKIFFTVLDTLDKNFLYLTKRIHSLDKMCAIKNKNNFFYKKDNKKSFLRMLDWERKNVWSDAGFLDHFLRKYG